MYGVPSLIFEHRGMLCGVYQPIVTNSSQETCWILARRVHGGGGGGVGCGTYTPEYALLQPPFMHRDLTPRCVVIRAPSLAYLPAFGAATSKDHSAGEVI